MAMGIPLTKDSSLMLSRAKQAQISTLNYYDNVDLCRNLIDSADIIVDSIFGIGFHGAPDRDVSEIINIVNNSSAKKVALDLPSGLTADNEIRCGRIHLAVGCGILGVCQRRLSAG